jgi:multimeric flavodoxin WrbA
MMNITILNGNPDAQNRVFDGYVCELAAILQAGGHTVNHLMLREMNISYCIGCFGCWVKTPGECQSADDSHLVRRAIIGADVMVWASPLRMGFPSALLKQVMDKSIPLLHPYFEFDQNEVHHRARYKHYPRLGLLMQREPDSDANDIHIVTDLFRRNALNMKSHLSFAALTDEPVNVVAHAIIHPPEQLPTPTNRLGPRPGIRIAPPTRLTLFNGSPRGQKGNTPILLAKFAEGFTATGQQCSEILPLNHLKEAVRFRQTFAEAECVLLGFPLYTDAMPAIVKAFIETLEPLRGQRGNPPLGFLVQSGFPEAAHSRHIERYLEKLAARLGSPYLGTILKGGCEGIRLMPDSMNRQTFMMIRKIGRVFGETGEFDPALLGQFARPERYPIVLAPVLNLIARMPLFSAYWDSQLKQNNAYARRFDQPYSS